MSYNKSKKGKKDFFSKRKDYTTDLNLSDPTPKEDLYKPINIV